ncbi:MAG: hypothetical protein IJ106_02820, partial [Parasporobacterium sp.]|nr:hypothetical protein [Parasporobacterium sp.]
MKLLENLIPVFAKMTGIVNANYLLDGPNSRMEANMEEVNGDMDFTAHSTAGRHPQGAEDLKNAAKREIFDSATENLTHLR